MFSKNKKATKEPQASKEQHKNVKTNIIMDRESSSKDQNKIAKDTVFTGEIESEGDFRVEGKLKGSIKTSKKVVIGKTGFVDGEIECENADLVGKFVGTIKVFDVLSLKSSAVIEDGNLIVGKLSVEHGAQINGTCTMKGDLKNLGDGKEKRKIEEDQKIGQKGLKPKEEKKA